MKKLEKLEKDKFVMLPIGIINLNLEQSLLYFYILLLKNATYSNRKLDVFGRSIELKSGDLLYLYTDYACLNESKSALEYKITQLRKKGLILTKVISGMEGAKRRTQIGILGYCGKPECSYADMYSRYHDKVYCKPEKVSKNHKISIDINNFSFLNEGIDKVCNSIMKDLGYSRNETITSDKATEIWKTFWNRAGVDVKGETYITNAQEKESYKLIDIAYSTWRYMNNKKDVIQEKSLNYLNNRDIYISHIKENLNHEVDFNEFIL